ncbi:MAG TPA: cytochrome c [Steroidobacteraceae bacterium]|jgi:mono/diheme cytochrome c family protein
MKHQALLLTAPLFALTVALTSALAGCERGLHEMYDQPKYKPLTPTPLFADGNSSRQQVPGTVPHSAGALAGTSSGRSGTLDPARTPGPATPVDAPNPLPITLALLTRGRGRFDIYCAPCHGRAGYGDGMIARRGFPAPPSFHTPRLRAAPDSHFFQVMSDGYGVMYPYADRITTADRWAIVAYIRALQLSQHVPAPSLEAQDQDALQASAR